MRNRHFRQIHNSDDRLTELDQLTGNFSHTVGPSGFGRYSILTLFSAGLILIGLRAYTYRWSADWYSGQFSLFFGTQKLKNTSGPRNLAWFMGQFVYTCSIIVLISGTYIFTALLNPHVLCFQLRATWFSPLYVSLFIRAMKSRSGLFLGV